MLGGREVLVRLAALSALSHQKMRSLRDFIRVSIFAGKSGASINSQHDSLTQTTHKICQGFNKFEGIKSQSSVSPYCTILSINTHSHS